jgi:hypothetical protein
MTIAFFADRNDALLVAFAYATKATDLGVEIAGAQPDELRHSQAGRVQDFQHGAVPQAAGSLDVGLVEQALDIVKAKIARQITVNLRRFEIRRRIFGDHALDLGKAEKIAQADQVSGHSLALELLAIKSREEIHYVVAADGFEAELAFAGEVIEFYEIAPIGGYGVGREPFFHPHMGQKRRNGCRDFHQFPVYPSPVPTVRRMAIP